MDEFNLENERDLLNSLKETILSSTEHNLREFMDDIPQIFVTDNLKAVSHKEETNGEKTHTLFDKFSISSVSTSKDNVKEIAALEAKCEELRAQVERLTKEKEGAFKEIERLKDQILNQSTYCTSLGAVLGNLTWRASRFPQIVDAWLSNFQNKIGEFLSLVNGTFGAFVNTYRSVFPPTSNIEYQFVMGLLGIVSNISASPEGRQFLITNSSGTEFVQKLIKLTPELPPAPGTVSLKRLMLMILYNVSMNKTGLEYLLESRVGDALSHCLDDEASSEEMQLLCLRVLQSVTYDLDEPKYVHDLTTIIPIETIETMTFAKRSDISDAAKQVVKNLRHSQKITK
ncbi:PREDICTED: heat shock factor 2-binding protein-like [Wasmannia auropunctata]|uniref:heat shock factor 2-binding protein-like n=1 Tax=Wasmannia auropunctata TaxID=64793 RepID=UPI0005EEC67A|nr:PREDICTED: heat shock factor 2-binding protein-like [Wasmannia auropunctata]XP_011686736.1 PREDICTED: heat shock factor 2-binding protein-like [Wasmannia auropunctata]XP_011686737.1 PREDICTED: heat shock factor 2-binding protein-like [Wasmannia auropunctata]